MKKRITALLLLLVVAALLCACGSKQKNRTPEETAMMFVKAVMNNDSEAFSQCVHPKMLEEWRDSFLGDDSCQLTEIHTGMVTDMSEDYLEYMQDYYGEEYKDFDYSKEYLEELQNSFSEEYGIANITAAKTVTVYVKYHNYRTSKDVSDVVDCKVFLSDSCWYAWGWS